MAWVYAPGGKCWINTQHIEQIIDHKTPMGDMSAYYDREWIEITGEWHERPPEMVPGDTVPSLVQRVERLERMMQEDDGK